MVHEAFDLASYPVLSDLAGDERCIAYYSLRIHERLEVLGACYHLAFFHYLFFKNECKIETTPVVGWINDGSDDFMISHAWIELNNKKIDTSLVHVEYLDQQQAGNLLILDRVVLPGQTYSYHRSRSEAARRAAKELAKTSPQNRALVEETTQLNAKMLSISKDDSRIRNYLDSAPNGLTYDRLRTLAVQTK